jgi:tetratricopeptide (TPR) repeat protein
MDAYQTCPCGSGKKVKFCCQKLLPEMGKIERLQDNQPELALQHLDKLEQTHADNPWIVTSRATIQLQLGRLKDAKLTLVKFLKAHPDHPRANAVYAIASLEADGLPQAKKAVHRAYKRSVSDSPAMVVALLEAMAEWHLTGGKFLAGRAHLLIAMRLANDEEHRNRLVQAILQLDGDATIPFPLRGGHLLPHLEPAESQLATYDKARRLSVLACWEEAADLLEEMGRQAPVTAELKHMQGLFRAWDGDELRAADVLHEAARLYGDSGRAVECEALAQFFDRTRPESSTALRVKRYRVASVSQLLTRLDDSPRFYRSDSGEVPGSQDEPTAMYLALDRAVPAKEDLAQLDVDSTPLYSGRVMVFDAVPDDDLPATAVVTGLEGEQLTALTTTLEQAGGELLEAFTPPSGDPSNPMSQTIDTLGQIPNDELPLHRNYFVPPQTPGNVRSLVLDGHWDRLIADIWPSSTLSVLGGKSPVEAARDPSLRVPLEAALVCFECFVDGRGRMLDVAGLRRRVGLEPTESPAVTAETQIAELSSFDLLRLSPALLSNEQLQQLVLRLESCRQTRLMYEALTELHHRAAAGTLGGDDQAATKGAAATQLATLAAAAHRFQEALDWNAQIEQEIHSGSAHPFEARLMCKLRELRIRVESQAPETLRDLLVHLWETYTPKLPQLRQQLSELVQSVGIDAPWESAIITAGGGWSPAAATTPDAPKKLWWPGQ